MKKGLLFVGLGIGTGILLFALSGKKDDTPGSMNQSADQQGIKASYPPAQYKIWADEIYDSLKSYILGYFRDDEEKVLDIFKNLNNDKDLALLSQEFGTREFGLVSAFGMSDKKTLAQVMSSEIGKKYNKAINQLFQAKGISYRY